MQAKNKPQKRRKYGQTFKDEVLKMIANGQSVPYVAQALGISEALIYKWNQRIKGKEKQPLLGQASEVFLENQHLQQHIQQLEIERDILKKALGIVSRQT